MPKCPWARYWSPKLLLMSSWHLMCMTVCEWVNVTSDEEVLWALCRLEMQVYVPFYIQRDRSLLYSVHHPERLLISSRYELSLIFIMWLMMVLSSPYVNRGLMLVSAVIGVNRRGLSTQAYQRCHCHSELWSLLVRWSNNIQFSNQLMGEIVLNAELKSTNTI